MLVAADFDTVYNVPLIMGPPPYQVRPECKAPSCFIGSYAPITHAGQNGPYWVNTYFLQPNRKLEVVGPVTIRSSAFKSC